jgi:preprotein translocase subunit SecY
MSSVVLAMIVAFTFIYMAIASEERQIAEQAERIRKRDMSY